MWQPADSVMTVPESRAVDIATELIEQLIGNGSTEVVLSPGSRSGPLALAAHAADAQGLLRLHVRVDEREAGFLALGMAKASGRPVAVIVTSGTAAANLHPALLEARHGAVPLIAVTADRPARLRGTGANQTTDQRRMFGGIDYLDQPEQLAGGAVAGGPAQDSLPVSGQSGSDQAGLGSGWPHGPVQLNVEFDEPLIEPVQWTFASVDPQRAAEPRVRADVEVAEPVLIRPDLPTIVIAGDAGAQAQSLAERTGWPLLAEPSSGARSQTALISGRLLLDSPLVDAVEQVVSFGHSTLSRQVVRLLTRKDLNVVHVGSPANFPAEATERVRFASSVELAGPELADPDSAGRVDGGQAGTDRAGAGRAGAGRAGAGRAGAGRAWAALWSRADAALTAAVDELIERRADAAPLRVARAVAEAVPQNGLLVVGSSQSIRDLDLVARPWDGEQLIIANRGLAGIDGTGSTAIGAALARQRQFRGTAALALMGDLSFLHGANGLLIGPQEPRPELTIVVVNDDGGSIFASLEQGDPAYADSFERVYATGTGTDLEALCRAHGIAYRELRADELREGLAERHGLNVVQVRVERASRRELSEAIAAAARTQHRQIISDMDGAGYRR